MSPGEDTLKNTLHIYPEAEVLSQRISMSSGCRKLPIVSQSLFPKLHVFIYFRFGKVVFT